MTVVALQDDSSILLFEGQRLKNLGCVWSALPSEKIPFSTEFLKLNRKREAMLFPLPAMTMVEVRNTHASLFADDEKYWSRTVPSAIARPKSQWTLIDLSARKDSAQRAYAEQKRKLKQRERYVATAHEVVWSLLIRRATEGKWPASLSDIVIRTSTSENSLTTVEGGSTLCVLVTENKVRLFPWPKKYCVGAVVAAHRPH